MEGKRKIIIKSGISVSSIEKMKKPIERMTHKNYKGKDLRTHIYTTPDMYIGSDQLVNQRVLMFNTKTNLIEEANLNHIPAVFQLYMEVISNAADGIDRSRRMGWDNRDKDGPPIIIFVSDGWVICRNYGVPISVDIHEESGLYTPSYIFGTVFTSSNYNNEDEGEERHEGGRNGVGAKVTNIFSAEFVVEVNDIVNNKHFSQTWRNNMLNPEDPIISDIIDDEDWVEIRYKLKFSRFKISNYNIEYLSMFQAAAINLSFTCKCPVMYNERLYNNQHIAEYGSYIFGNLIDECMIHYELRYPEEEEIKSRMCSLGFKVPTPILKNGVEPRTIIPLVELLLIDPSYLDKRIVISFVNSLMTVDNGIHVDSVYDIMVPSITKRINEGRKRDPLDPSKLKGRAALLAKMKAKKSKAKKKESKPKEPKKKINATNVKPHISMILCCRVVNPKFTSQSKTKLASPEIYMELSEKEIGEILSWKLMDLLKSTLRSIQLTALTKTDGRKVRHIKLKKGFDANFAGGPNSNKCILFVVEGDSALAYATRYISAIGPEARDIYGVIPIKGKLLNVKKAAPDRIADNAEIALLKKVLGLKEGVDYSDIQNYDQLRYHRLCIMTDADSDGSHIKGLIINVFDELYPGLIETGFICDYRTKYLRIEKGKTHFDFYTPDEYEQWKLETPDSTEMTKAGKLKWKHNYYKGLGTSEKKDVKEDSENPLFIDFTYDRRAANTINVAFGKINAEDRKNWLEEWRITRRRPFIIRDMEYMTLTTFFNREFILYVLDSLERAIPRFADGLKRSQGQIVWGVMKKWPSYSGEKIKVAQLSGYIAGIVDYKHNEQCLADAIKSMARYFTGSNNLPLLQPLGQFGERIFGGIDAASARYIFTKPFPIMKYIFSSKDTPILEFFTDSGNPSDPKNFIPIIPFALINGIIGVATAYSTNVMNYNPIEIIDWILDWIEGKQRLPKLIPWYRGFTGEIYLISGGKGKEEDDGIEGEITIIEEQSDGHDDSDDPELDDVEGADHEEIKIARQELIEETAGSTSKYDQVIIRGKFSVNNKGTITVTELPIGRWPINYYYFLEDLREIKEISDFKDNTTDDAILYTIKGMKKPTFLKLNLIRKLILSNMVFLDEDGIPKRYENISEYMNEFCEYRLRKYQDRKNYEIKHMEEILEKLEYKSLLVELIISGEIVVINRSISSIKTNMFHHNIPEYIYDEMNLRHVSEDDVISIGKELDKTKAELEDLINTEPHEIWQMELASLRSQLYKNVEMHRTIPGIYGKPPRYVLEFE